MQKKNKYRASMLDFSAGFITQGDGEFNSIAHHLAARRLQRTFRRNVKVKEAKRVTRIMKSDIESARKIRGTESGKLLIAEEISEEEQKNG